MAIDDLDGPSRPTGSGPLDGMFANTNIIVLVIFAFCCSTLALILSIIAFLTAKDPKAKNNAMIVMIVGAIITVLYSGAYVTRVVIR
jgi:hypothetical protein